jgi:hypothetical protein
MADHLRGKVGVFRGIDVEHAGAEHGDRTAASVNRSAMRRGIDAAGQSAHHGVASPNEAAGEVRGDSLAVGRGMTRADDRHGQGIARLQFAADEEQPRWVVDAGEKSRVAIVSLDQHRDATAAAFREHVGCDRARGERGDRRRELWANAAHCGDLLRGRREHALRRAKTLEQHPAEPAADSRHAREPDMVEEFVVNDGREGGHHGLA